MKVFNTITKSAVAVRLLFTCVVTLNVCGLRAATPVAGDYTLVPPTIKEGADPFVMIDLSVELTQQAEAFTDGDFTYLPATASDTPLVCNDRVSGWGICYADTMTYMGYFDPFKCYDYDDSNLNIYTDQRATGPHDDTDPHHFVPTGPTNAGGHTCSGNFSGNFLNWASMTALDEFRMVMTGGARLLDTSGSSAKTLLVRARRYNDWSFVAKRISSAGLSGYVADPASVTPFAVTELRMRSSGGTIIHEGRQQADFMRFEDGAGNLLTTDTPSGYYNVVVEVCRDEAASSIVVEDNCVAYTDGVNTWYKPEGLLQRNALKMRYALMSYQGRDGNAINGGVLRAKAKYIGTQRRAPGGGLETNPNAEVDSQGKMVYNPDNVTLGSGVENSGVLNYINHFALTGNRYKSNDPVAELYYESLRYIKNLAPTPEYSAGLTNIEKDNFPVFTTWDDPIADSCQNNNVLYVGDQFAWSDHNLPGMGGTSAIAGTAGVPAVPSNADPDIDAWAETDAVGVLEGYTGGAGSLADATRGRANNGWWFAGLAYYARSNDLRSGVGMPEAQYVKTFVIDTREYNSSPPLKWANPLWLAAKYGGFEEATGVEPAFDPNNGAAPNGDPAISTPRWDADGDTEPDTFTVADQPTKLVAGLTSVFAEIVERLSASSAAAVVSNSTSGTGAVYQGLYEPRKVEGNKQVEWTGALWGYFIDKDGRTREDTVVTAGKGNGVIDSTDPWVEFVMVGDQVMAQRHDPVTDAVIGAPVALDQTGKIWNAHDELAGLTSLTAQRTYSSSADTGRFITTWIDADGDDLVDDTEILDFTASNFPDPATSPGSNQFRYLGLDSTNASVAPDLVDFIRGEENQATTGFRNRTLSGYTYRLGDIVHSSPQVVGTPRSFYDVTYDDDSYTEFRDFYLNRRQVIYVGANDGMIHAFNGGFWDASTESFQTSYSGEVAHPLGAELWAFVPQNLLPHLQWLAQVDYPHVYYVDGEPQTFDVNIFPTDTDHPYGWGTILVVGLRFGGGDFTLDPDSDIDGDTSDDITMRSSFLVFDVTNPEKEPTLLAEIALPNQGYTTVRPSLVKYRAARNNGSFKGTGKNKWFLAFGSGPSGTDAATKQNALIEAVSNQNAKVFYYDLVANDGTVTEVDLTTESNAFVGGMIAADLNGDFKDDALYFGTVARKLVSGVFEPTGNMNRIKLAGASTLIQTDVGKIKPLVAVDQPVSSQPMVGEDPLGNHWIHFGTGRFYVTPDVTLQNQESFYGVKELINASGVAQNNTVSKTNLVDTTGIQVFGDGSIKTAAGGTPVPLSAGGDTTTATTFTQMLNFVDGHGGWVHDLPSSRNRVVTRSTKFSNTVLYVDYEASDSTCKPQGESFLVAVHERTGTGAPFAPIGLLDPSNTASQVIDRISMGGGLVTGLSVVDHGDSTGTIIYNRADAAVGTQKIIKEPVKSGRQSWREILQD